jgi:hypothetical protein
MDFGKVLSFGFAQAWRYKSLWVLGVFVGGMSFSFGSSDYDLRAKLGTGYLDIQQDIEHLREFLNNWPLILGIVVLGFLIGIILFALHIMAEGALIDAADRLHNKRPYTFSEAITKAASRFWNLVGIYLIYMVISIAVVLFAILFIFLVYQTSPAAAILAILMAFPVGLVVFFILTFTLIFAERETVIRQTGVIDSITEGISLLRHNIGNSIIFAIIIFAILIGMLVFFGILGLIGFGIGSAVAVEENIFVTVIAGMIGFALLLLVQGYTGAAFSLIGTEFYFAIKSRELPPPPAEGPQTTQPTVPPSAPSPPITPPTPQPPDEIPLPPEPPPPADDDFSGDDPERREE